MITKRKLYKWFFIYYIMSLKKLTQTDTFKELKATYGRRRQTLDEQLQSQESTESPIETIVDHIHHHWHDLVDFFKDDFAKSFKDGYQTLKEKLRDYTEGFVDILNNTRTEVYIGLTLGALIAGTWSYNHESNKNHTLRLAFSETSQIEQDARKMGIKVPHATDYLSKANDFYMKIFEAWNESWDRISVFDVGDNTKMFSSELEFRTEITFKRHHYELPQLTPLVTQLADSLANDYNYLRGLQQNVLLSVDYFDKAWEDYHHDEYHTEIYYETETSTDSNGNTTTTTVMKTRQVYDYTDNEYIYHKWAGENASKKMNNIFQWYPEIKTDGQFILASQTNAENEYAIERSRKDELENKILRPEEYMKIANSWLSGSSLYNNLLVIGLSRKVN